MSRRPRRHRVPSSTPAFALLLTCLVLSLYIVALNPVV